MNANIKNTLFDLVGREQLPASYADEAQAVRINSQLLPGFYMGIRAMKRFPTSAIWFSALRRPRI